MFKFIKALQGFLIRREHNIVANARRQSNLRFESLEMRRVLAANAADSIMGTVFADLNADDSADVGEGVEGASVLLFQDDGDGIFNANTDTQVGATILTDADGNYCFDNLDQSLTYFVQQPAQTAGNKELEARVSPLIDFTPELIIDEFVTTQTTSAVPPPIANDESSLILDESEVLGRERDLAVQLTTGNSEVQLRVNPFGQQDVLLFDSSAGTTGERVITWDGLDNDGDQLAMGLGGRDLTVGGTLNSVSMLIGVDANGANAEFRIYQGNSSNVSIASFPIPVTGGTATQWVNVPFSAFSGPVDPSNVDAIELELLTDDRSVDGQIEVIGIAGAKVVDFDHDCLIDLELEKTVDSNSVNSGDTVNWTVRLTNNETNANASATGVTVSDILPAGVTFVNANPSAGTFNNGVWTLPDPLDPGDTESIVLTATVNAGLAGGTVIRNVAQVSAHNEPDIDSEPNNDDGDQSQDDEDNVEITVSSAVDLEITKVANTNDIEPGGQVTFTITLQNNPSTANTAATGVVVTDTLPVGMSLVSGTPTGSGTFDSNTRTWTLVDPLAPGAQQTLTIVANVDSNVEGNSELTNVAQVTAVNEPDVDSTPNNDDGDQSEDDEDMAVFTVGSVVDVELTKTVNVQNVDPGGQITWTLNASNNPTNANAAATNVQITDVLPAGTTLVMATPSGSGTFSNGVWSLVDPLSPGSTATLTLMTTVDSNLQSDTLVNTAQVTSVDQDDIDSQPNNDDGDQSEDDEAMAMVGVNPQIDLELTKTVSASVVQVGDEVTWTVDLTNNAANANSDATGVTVTDVIPAGLNLVSATPNNGSFAGNTWTLGTALAPGASATLTLVTMVDANTTLTSIENVAEVGSANETDIDSAPGNDDGDQSEDDEDSVTITLTPVQIDLELSKTVDASTVQVGNQVTWTVSITNNPANANADATGVTVTDVLPAGLNLISATPNNGTFAGNTWTLGGPLAPGASATLTILTQVDPNTTLTSIENIAQVGSANETDIDSVPGNDDGDQSEDDEDNAIITVTPSRIDLELTKTVAASVVDPGDQVSWTISVTNNQANANSDATGVVVTDVLPTGVSLVSGTPSTGTFSGNTWNIGTLAPGAFATLSLATTVNNQSGGTVLENVAQVSAANETDIDSVPGNDDGDQSEDDEDNASITVRSIVDVQVEKSVDRNVAEVGDNVTWSIVVTNDGTVGNTAATGVIVSDVLPAGVTFVSSNATLGSYNSGSGSWVLGSPLQPGQSATLTIVSTVNSSAEGQTLLNVAQVTATNESDIDSTPGNDDGDQSEDDESPAEVIIQLPRPISKRSLLSFS